MAKSKHTPGPWRITRTETIPVSAKSLNVINPKREAKFYEIKGAQVAVVANIKEVNLRSDEQTEANARLIAAAPELLDTLESLWVEVQNHYGLIVHPELEATVVAAITKARGKD